MVSLHVLLHCDLAGAHLPALRTGNVPVQSSPVDSALVASQRGLTVVSHIALWALVDELCVGVLELASSSSSRFLLHLCLV